MGHDICGFASSDAPRDDGLDRAEIAYLRRGAGNPLARSIYRALNVVDADCGCSGCGVDTHFTEADLAAALTRLPDDEDHEPERQFLRDCIAKGGSGAWIGFY